MAYAATNALFDRQLIVVWDNVASRATTVILRKGEPIPPGEVIFASGKDSADDPRSLRNAAEQIEKWTLASQGKYTCPCG